MTNLHHITLIHHFKKFYHAGYRITDAVITEWLALSIFPVRALDADLALNGIGIVNIKLQDAGEECIMMES